jgi:23S rRNA maturation mini-RNase III
MLKELQDKAKGTEAGKQQAEQVQDLMKKMDETETDLVNKRVNPAVNNRQKDILTRLLESEKALRQQEEDPKRQAEAAKQQKVSQPSFVVPDSQSRSRQVEALRTVSPAYNLFYKRESNRYLQKLTK